MKKNGAWIRRNNWWVSALFTFSWGVWSFIQDFDRSANAYKEWYKIVLDALVIIQKGSLVFFVMLILTSIWWFWTLKNDKNWTIINQSLNQTRDKVFRSCQGEPKEHHQVTLFEFKSTYWKEGYIEQSVRNLFSKENDGWLVPVTRAGHTGQRSGAVFPVNDDSVHCQGICGLAWASNSIKSHLELPRITKDSSEKSIKSYAEKSNCSRELVRSKIRRSPKAKKGHNPCILPRSIIAFPIGEEGSSEAPKYILVFDSRKNNGIAKEVRDEYSVVNQLLGSLLGGV